MQTHEMTVGDTMFPIGGKLYHEDEDGVLIGTDMTDRTVKFVMARSSSQIKVDHVDATVISVGPPAEVQYSFSADDVDEAGIFYGKFVVFDSLGRKVAFPKGFKEFKIVISPFA